MSKRHLAGLIVLVVTASLVIGSPAFAKKKKKTRYDEWYTYTVPFTCGVNEFVGESTVPGEYATAVSITNANPFDTSARARVQLTEPSDSRSDRIRRKLRAGRSFLIDCEMLLGGAFIQPVPLDVDTFYQGVLTVDSRARLNVVVQSSASGPDGGIALQSRQVGPLVIKHRRDDDDDDQVAICHAPPGNPDNRHTIYVGKSAVDAHRRHGDEMGECDDDD